VRYLLALVFIFAGLFVLLMIGGFLSAAYEIHRERKAGLVPTRPAWERRDWARQTGGHRAYFRGLRKGLRR
jgi:hypothetical protein